MQMWIKYFVLSLLLLFPSSLLSDCVVSFVAPLATGCVKDASNLVMDLTTGDDGGASLSLTDAFGQSISYGSAWNLHSIKILFGAATSGAYVTVRIGTDLTSPVESWVGVAAPDGGGWLELVSSSNDAYSSSTTYYIGIIITAGTATWRYDGTSPPYSDGSYFSQGSGWTLGGALTTRDFEMQVFKCQ